MQHWAGRRWCFRLGCLFGLFSIQVRATAGALAYRASGVELLSHLDLAQFSQLAPGSANDVWGYVSPSGREYAILGLNPGTAFIEITNPTNPVIVGQIMDAASSWSDMKTYGHYAYNCTENSGGIQVIDLDQIDDGVVTLVGALTQSGLTRSHTLAVNTDSGYLYLCGANLSPTGLYAVSLADPADPALVPNGRWTGSYVHAAQVISYDSGPYAGLEIAFIFGGGNGLFIVDVTTKTAMTTLSQLVYPTLGYCHQGWLSPDRQYLFINDEFDERQGLVPTTTTYVVDVSDLSSPSLFTTITTHFRSVDHNLMVTGDYVYEANYTTGLHMYDIGDMNDIKHVGYYDTYPLDDDSVYKGAWGVFSDFPSGVVAISDIQGGLFVLDPSEARSRLCGLPPPPRDEPNPMPKNRYLAFEPPVDADNAAIQVTFRQLPAAFSSFDGETRWVGAPYDVNLPGGGTMRLARLQCDAVYRDWRFDGLIRIIGPEIVPGAVFELAALEPTCPAGGDPVPSIPLTLSTTMWGDVTSHAIDGAPDGVVNFTDIAGVVDRFRSYPQAPPLDRADLVPEIANQMVSFSDVSAAVDGFQSDAYPFGGPTVCP